ncbi:MAG: response regulator transcription factor [Candidatus Tectimicrobiota bacterium]
MPPAPIRIVLTDDHRQARGMLRDLLHSYGHVQVVAEASSQAEALACIERHQPDIVVIDSVLPLPYCLELEAHVRQVFPPSRTIVVSSHVLLASATAEHNLELAIHSSATCQLETPVADLGQDAPPVPLTVRQHEVLRLVVAGLTTKEIAQQLQRSVKTIEAHRTQIMQRLGVHNVAELVRRAMEDNLYRPSA